MIAGRLFAGPFLLVVFVFVEPGHLDGFELAFRRFRGIVVKCGKFGDPLVQVCEAHAQRIGVRPCFVEFECDVVDLVPGESGHDGISIAGMSQLRFNLVFVVAAAVALAQMPASERSKQLASFELVWSTVRAHNPDRSFHGLDWQSVHDTVRPRVEKARDTDEVRSILREMVGWLGESHYSLIPGDRYSDIPIASPSLAASEGAPGPVGQPEAVGAASPQEQSPPPSGKAVQFGNLPQLNVEFEARRLSNGVGYIRFNEFLDPASFIPRFQAALRDFAVAPGVILDLRGNRGGIGLMASGVAGFFVKQSGLSLGEMRMNGTTLRLTVFPRAATFDGRVAILIDGGSASTAEIFAQGMQDLKRARIFGERSAGAALMSDIIRLPNGDGFQYPTAGYKSASGRVLEGNGVKPDVEAGPDSVIDIAARWIVSGQSQ